MYFLLKEKNSLKRFLLWASKWKLYLTISSVFLRREKVRHGSFLNESLLSTLLCFRWKQILMGGREVWEGQMKHDVKIIYPFRLISKHWIVEMVKLFRAPKIAVRFRQVLTLAIPRSLLGEGVWMFIRGGANLSYTNKHWIIKEKY